MTTDTATIESLIVKLGKGHSGPGAHARDELVKIGSAAVPYLVAATRDQDSQRRWEAGKALGGMGDGRAVPALVAMLEDKDSGNRWVAAHGLGTMGKPAVVAVMQALIDRAGSVWLRDGAHHVLHDMAGSYLGSTIAPVLQALEQSDAESLAPIAAHEALLKLGA
ncbi:MAG: HEAT repeat domain-containing protein [Anaerolineae bacterium]|nr:MAG: HEAT repeat domain-containing protein [Anaerolineae bacterium]